MRFRTAVQGARFVRYGARSPRDFYLVWQAIRRFDAIQKPVELFRLARYLRRHGRRAGLRTVMEIGTRHGGSLYLWSRLADPRASLISVDFHPRVNDADAVRQLGAIVVSSQRLHCVRRDSHDRATLVDVSGALLGGKLDLLFIDGDHRYDGARQDFEMYSPLVRSGGVIVFHDIVENPEHPDYGVARLWRELMPAYKHHEFVDAGHPEPGMGLGVLVMP